MLLRSTRFVILTVVAAGALACSGGGSGSGGVVDGGGGGSSLLAASFVPASPSPGANTVAAAEASASGDLVTVAVNVSGTNDVFGADFEVLYDASSVLYLGWAPGSLLETGGNSPTYLLTPSSGRIIIGASRNGGNGVNVSGTATLVLLTFQVTSAGSSALTFANADLLDGQPPGPSPIPGLTWSGGNVLAN